MTDPAPPKTFPNIQGRCPACRGDSLFIGSGGYITCSRLDCPNPSAADELLHGEHVAAHTPLICSDERHAAKVTDLERQLAALRAVARGYCPACGRGDAAPTVEDWEEQRQNAAFWVDQHQRARQSASDQRQRAKRAEAALREALDCIIFGNGQPRDPNDLTRWRTALAGEQPAPAATQTTELPKLRCDCPPTNAGLELCPACPGRTKEQPGA
ncbi:hypothetical protein [Streptomyces sp. NPDC008240]|uniref:hypothetical protein n=1 Tax=Streptomyces sp. NPDC008240 TaxID=3364822 RepID=UPI0036F1315C